MATKAAEKRTCSALARRPLRSGRHIVPTTHRKLLLEVAFKLRPWELQELGFSVRDVVPEKAAETLTALGLLECLERHGLIAPGKYGVLREYLREMGREDLAGLLAPPEELATGSRTRPSSSGGSLSRIASLLDVNSAVWPFSTYRRNVQEVFRGLGEGEVEQLRWLSQDFLRGPTSKAWFEEMTAVELLEALENSGLLGPGNYTFLVDCLEEIGRPDLLVHILPPTLPHLPASMDLPALMCHQRFESIQLKKTQHDFGMRHLMKVTDNAQKNTAQLAVGWHGRILGALSPKLLMEHSSFMMDNLPETLINTSLHINDLLDSIQEYERNGDTPKFAQHVSDCECHLSLLQGLMEEIDWDHTPRMRESIATSRQYHPVMQGSYGASSSLAELLLEFTGSRERLQANSRQLNQTLTRLESLLRLSGYMWSLTSWLVALLQVAVHSPVDLRGYDFLFRLLIQRNGHIIRSNSDILQSVLGPTSLGEKLLTCFRKRDLITEPGEGNLDPVLYHVGATPIPVFAFVLLFLSEHPSLDPDGLEEIIDSLKLYVSKREEAFCRINRDVTVMVLSGIGRNIEDFRSSNLQDLQSQPGVANLFSY